MQAIYDMFSERINEIELYYNALQELDDNSKKTDHVENYLKDDFIKILKANALLMIYNLVESTVMGGIMEIYDKFRQEGLAYSSVRKEIKDIWFSYKFKQVYDKSAHYHSYKDKALEIVNSIMTGEIIELDRKATDISGNLDAKQIRNVCNDHGINFPLTKAVKVALFSKRLESEGIVWRTERFLLQNADETIPYKIWKILKSKL